MQHHIYRDYLLKLAEPWTETCCKSLHIKGRIFLVMRKLRHALVPRPTVALFFNNSSAELRLSTRLTSGARSALKEARINMNTHSAVIRCIHPLMSSIEIAAAAYNITVWIRAIIATT